MRPAIFLDRDGVLIENRSEYVRDLRDVEFLPGTFEALRCAAALPREFALVIVSNQAGVGKGVITAEAAEAIQAFVVGEIASHGGRIDRAYFCPHRADENCGCRKPPSPPRAPCTGQTGRESSVRIMQLMIEVIVCAGYCVTHASKHCEKPHTPCPDPLLHGVDPDRVVRFSAATVRIHTGAGAQCGMECGKRSGFVRI